MDVGWLRHNLPLNKNAHLKSGRLRVWLLRGGRLIIQVALYAVVCSHYIILKMNFNTYAILRTCAIRMPGQAL